MISHEQHIKLLSEELILIKYLWEKTLQKSAATMLEKGELYVSKYIGYDSKRGNILVKFNNKVCLPPRKNEHLVGFVPHKEKQNFKKWGGLRYEELYVNGRYLSFETSSVFYDYQKDYTVVGFSGISEADILKIEKDTLLYFGPPKEPIEYIADLHQFLKNTSPEKNKILNLNIKDKNWDPIPLNTDNDVISRLQSDLIEKDIVIIQGPPGTGKTYLMAQLCATLLREKYKIMVTALTNRALVEMAEKKHLQIALQQGSVYKTALSADESKNKKLKGIKRYESLSQNPELLLATYYSMSQIATKSTNNNPFDYIIVEEGSQAFLSTIALARTLGKKCIVIGDIKQLQPIFHKEPGTEDPNNYHWMINGLKAISYYFRDCKQYILTNSYRLVPNAVKSTNAFYNNVLKSKSNVALPLNFKGISVLERSLNINGGTTLKRFNIPSGKIPSRECGDFIINIINKLKSLNPKSEIAVLAFHRASIRSLQRTIFSSCENKENVLVETIDRIQGMTTDFCLFFIPDESFPFSLQPNRFNVATSRVRLCTLLIADETLTNYRVRSNEVQKYIDSIETV